MFRLTFLGTSAAQPTLARNLSGLAVRREGELLLFDCGEGSQRQMMRYGTGFAVEAIFFTHFHADHYLGLLGFLRTLSMQGRENPLHLYGPAPAVAARQGDPPGLRPHSFPCASTSWRGATW
jgi:ribonuclease Z